MWSVVLLPSAILALLATSIRGDRPHIVLIVADDLGWNDVGFHGSNQVPTPNIDALAYSGVILNNYYVNPICTPSRSALMTGYHPIHTGLQSGVLAGAAPYALPLKFKLLPEHLNSLGYKSVAVGKWHLGSHRAVYTPTKRGFVSHLGYWTGHQDYYDHTAEELYYPVEGWGLDYRRNMSIAADLFGQYSTDVFTEEAVQQIINHKKAAKEQPLFLYLAHLAVHSANSYSPLQAPLDVVKKFSYIKDKNRRKFAGMLHKLDESVGIVVKALEKNDMLRNSIILFTTDNGGPAAGFNLNAASNWPLKGVKDTLWEGGVRGVGIIWSPLLQSPGRIFDKLINIEDWLPTLYSAAGGKHSDLPSSMDGMNLWTAIVKGSGSPARNIVLHNIDESRSIEAIRVGEWKYVKGTTWDGSWDEWYGPDGRNGSYQIEEVYSSKVAKSLKRIGIRLPPAKKVQKLRYLSTLTCSITEDAKPCHIKDQVCLFNITADPCEYNNLAFEYPSVIKQLRETIDLFRATAVPRLNKPVDPRADPKFFGYTWTNWADFVDDDRHQIIE